MGLTINAYGNCQPIDVVLDDDGEPVDPRTVRPYVNPNFPDQADDVVPDGWYQYETATSFEAGSYPSYGDWRRQLSALGGYELKDAWEGRVGSGAFLELVNFADNEGAIGARTSAKLADDFAANEDAARRAMDPYDFGLYMKWKEAFTMARDGGLVNFR